jgi:carbon monoxide dehydrogenase subunit G
MQHFEGERTFSLLPDNLWAKLRDAAFLASCVPEATIQGQATRDRALYQVQPGFSFARGTMEVTLDVLEGAEPTTLKYRLTSKGIGSSNVVETSLTLQPDAAGTRVQWTAEVVSLGGLLKMVPSGLIRGAAQKVIEDVWSGVASRLRVSAQDG